MTHRRQFIQACAVAPILTAFGPSGPSQAEYDEHAQWMVDTLVDFALHLSGAEGAVHGIGLELDEADFEYDPNVMCSVTVRGTPYTVRMGDLFEFYRIFEYKHEPSTEEEDRAVTKARNRIYELFLMGAQRPVIDLTHPFRLETGITLKPDQVGRITVGPRHIQILLSEIRDAGEKLARHQREVLTLHGDSAIRLSGLGAKEISIGTINLIVPLVGGVYPFTDRAGESCGQSLDLYRAYWGARWMCAEINRVGNSAYAFRDTPVKSVPADKDGLLKLAREVAFLDY